jgi:hypothetical protein
VELTTTALRPFVCHSTPKQLCSGCAELKKINIKGRSFPPALGTKEGLDPVDAEAAPSRRWPKGERLGRAGTI